MDEIKTFDTNDFLKEDNFVNKSQYKKSKNKYKKQENIEAENNEIEKVLNPEDEIIVDELKDEVLENIAVEVKEEKKKKTGKVIRKGAATISIETEDGRKAFLIGYKDAKVGDIVEY